MRREGDLDAESPVSDAGMSEMVKRVNDLAAKLHLDNIEIVTDTSMLEGKKKNAKGFYNRKTGKISIVVANHNDLADLEKTVLHESVAHHGLRKLFGEHFNAFLDKTSLETLTLMSGSALPSLQPSMAGISVQRRRNILQAWQRTPTLRMQRRQAGGRR